jgi:hypothetical protein
MPPDYGWEDIGRGVLGTLGVAAGTFDSLGRGLEGISAPSGNSLWADAGLTLLGAVGLLPTSSDSPDLPIGGGIGCDSIPEGPVGTGGIGSESIPTGPIPGQGNDPQPKSMRVTVIDNRTWDLGRGLSTIGGWVSGFFGGGSSQPLPPVEQTGEAQVTIVVSDDLSRGTDKVAADLGNFINNLVSDTAKAVQDAVSGLSGPNIMMMGAGVPGAQQNFNDSVSNLCIAGMAATASIPALPLIASGPGDMATASMLGSLWTGAFGALNQVSNYYLTTNPNPPLPDSEEVLKDMGLGFVFGPAVEMMPADVGKLAVAGVSAYASGTSFSQGNWGSGLINAVGIGLPYFLGSGSAPIEDSVASAERGFSDMQALEAQAAEARLPEISNSEVEARGWEAPDNLTGKPLSEWFESTIKVNGNDVLVRTTEDPFGNVVRVFGQAERSASTTPGHAEAMNDLVERLSQTGDYSDFYLQKEWRTASGIDDASTLKPDVIGHRRSGEFDAWEVQSKWDGRAALEARLREGMGSLPFEQRGVYDVIPPKPPKN